MTAALDSVKPLRDAIIRLVDRYASTGHNEEALLSVASLPGGPPSGDTIAALVDLLPPGGAASGGGLMLHKALDAVCEITGMPRNAVALLLTNPPDRVRFWLAWACAPTVEDLYAWATDVPSAETLGTLAQLRGFDITALALLDLPPNL